MCYGRRRYWQWPACMGFTCLQLCSFFPGTIQRSLVTAGLRVISDWTYWTLKLQECSTGSRNRRATFTPWSYSNETVRQNHQWPPSYWPNSQTLMTFPDSLICEAILSCLFSPCTIHSFSPPYWVPQGLGSGTPLLYSLNDFISCRLTIDKDYDKLAVYLKPGPVAPTFPLRSPVLQYIFLRST